MKPTTRTQIDLGRKCNMNCRFCYYRQLGDLRKQAFKSFEILTKSIDGAVRRGNNYIDWTGGEGSVYPRMPELIEYCLKRYDVKSCLITNGIAGEYTYKKIIDAGIDDFLLSVHGIGQNHDTITNFPGAFERQERTLEQIKKAKIKLRFNVVINRYNQTELINIAEYLATWKPRIVNFINMNLHHEWAFDHLTAKDVIADLDIVQPNLEQAIAYLHSLNIAVNVRYYPMCRLSPDYWQCICNDMHVIFDPYEWSYGINPITYENAYKWAVDCSNRIEEKGHPCNQCDLQNICGGINREFHKVAGDVCTPFEVDGIDKNDFLYFRRQNKEAFK